MKIYSAPKEVGPTPEFHPLDTYDQRCDEFVGRVKDYAKQHCNGNLRGEEVRFPVADGYARYIVFSIRPETLIHLSIGDAWQFPYANRLTAADIRKEVVRGQAIAKLFERRG
jgi:hypothetical protein